MHSFLDAKNRTWRITVNVNTIRRVKNLTGENLTEAIVGNLAKKMAGDPVLLIDVLYAVCQPECEAAQVSDTDFGEALVGDAIEHATEALVEELIGFFPQSRRAILGKAIEKGRAYQAAVDAELLRRVESVDVAAIVEMEAAETKTPGS